MKPTLACLPWAAALLGFPSHAQAQSCYDLRVQRDENRRVMLGIAADYPKTHTALVACFSDRSAPRSEAEACAGGVLAIACMGMGLTDCGDLMSRWKNAAQTETSIDRALKRQGCVQ